jgi:hypothetical protein
MVEYYYFVFGGEWYQDRPLLVPAAKFDEAIPDFIGLLVNSSEDIESDYCDHIVPVNYVFVDEKHYAMTPVESDKNNALCSILNTYAEPLQHSYQFYEGWDNDDPDVEISGEMNLWHAIEEDKLWWTEDIVNLNLKLCGRDFDYIKKNYTIKKSFYIFNDYPKS